MSDIELQELADWAFQGEVVGQTWQNQGSPHRRCQMDGRRGRLVAPVLDNLPTLTRSAAGPARPTGRWLATGWAAVLGVGWPLAFMIGLALEPVAAEPEAAVPILIELASLVFFAALVATVIAAARRRPAAASAGVVTGVVAVAFSVACPLSGHHGFGLWWIGQLGVMVTMLAVSVAALGHRSRTRYGKADPAG